MSNAPANVAIVSAYFNPSVIDDMLVTTRKTLEQEKATLVVEVKVPGSFEIPLVAEKLLARKDIDALVVLGYIEKGETLHGEIMGHIVYRSLIDAELRHQKPIGLGIIGPGATLEQALARKESCARNAARAALRMIEVMKSGI